MKPLRLLLMLLALSVFVAACGEDEEEPAATPAGGQEESGSGGKIQNDPANGELSLTIGSKNFTEQKVLGEIYAQGLEAAGFSINKDLNLGDEKTALAALKSDEITAYPEYTGTALLSFFGK
jgi:osmoprotectant transport system substrate-binding protein